MPSLGADMDEGTVVEWSVAPGDEVHRGDLIAAVETEKSVIDVECFEDGVVEALLVPVGAKVAVGTPLAVIGTDGAPAPSAPSAPSVPAEVPAPDGPPLPRATPPVRRFAERLGVDTGDLAGTGPHGTVTHADVRAATRPAPAASPAGGRLRVTPYARRLAAERGTPVEDLHPGTADGVVRGRDVPAAPPAPSAPRAATRAGADGMRAAIAARMTRSLTIPQYHVDAVLEVGAALDRLRELNRRAAVSARIVPAALFLHAVARAARRVPELNGHWVDGAPVPATSVDVGVVVSLRGGGLLVPTIPAADELALPDLMTALREVVERARAGRLRSSDTADAGLTVSDLGDTGGHAVHGRIFPPQVALVGLGAVVARPWADGDLLGVRPTVTTTLTGDHRATDGVVGGRFLHAVDDVLHDLEEWS
ncbi:pyruvate dehydrogenase complex dihydrolipoamide acetyltransferase [Actinomycetospora chlora]|uniref:Dihydrolipoamide acetyltransferase component of pyruvate dehydrogenase complex n=1 Tax=Actinomycetospora chlora TaxID=663608 RepID=A0ABP9B5H6_9PSEU